MVSGRDHSSTNQGIKSTLISRVVYLCTFLSLQDLDRLVHELTIKANAKNPETIKAPGFPAGDG